MSRYHNKDPFWMTAKFNGKCASCGSAIKRGTQIWYMPASRSAYGENCCDAGRQHERDFGAACFDEAAYSGGW